MVLLLMSTTDLVINLSGILREVDPYDFEMVEVVLKVIERADEKNTQHSYEAGIESSKASEGLQKNVPSGGPGAPAYAGAVITWPSAAQTRLPFHLLLFGTAQNFWKSLSTELTEESFPTLLFISKIMKFSLDTL
uniref:RZZ complex subunit KNTC1/ROD C-terminal domain-containing protein n=1 Tax=Myotis myotis TaxID=51298 RepID=A0A7J7VYN4_MYOMY|nr:hypothetical protein mMyoMyo1_012219 [Myotis myotis]